MHTSTLSTILAILVTVATLLISSTSIAHQSRHYGFSVNTYVIANRSGLARNYFTYSYDTRRAKKLAKYHFTNHRHHRYDRHHSDCPYTDHHHH